MIENGKILKSDLCKVLYIFVLSLNLVMQSLAGTNIQNITFFSKSYLYSLTPKISIAIFFVVILMNRYMLVSKMILSVILGVVAVTITAVTNNYAVALVLLAIMACPSNIEIENIAKWESRCLFFLICGTVLMSIAGIIPSDIVYRGEAIRKSYGFTSANAFANNTLVWIMLFGLQKKNAWNWKDTGVCCVIAGLVFSATNSRMAFVMSLVISLSFLLLSEKHSSIENAIYFVSKYCFSVLMLVCYICSWLYKEGYFTVQFNLLNVAMSYRLGFMRNYLRDYGIKPFGQIIRTVSYSQSLRTGEAWSGLDNSYMYILICWGIVISVALCVLYYKLGQFNCNCLDKYSAFVAVVLCIVGLTENYLPLIGNNISFVMIAIMISKNNELQGERCDGN